MNQLFRLSATAGLCTAAVIAVLIGMAHNNAALLAPIHLLLFLVAAAFYLLPTGLAMYRDCRSLVGIASLNILLGWTVLGWFAALGWAAGGKAWPKVKACAPPPNHALPTH